ncbi:hypothetical protein HDU78_005696 [Chytriomyces hyalinus]|nr:hypothetical protein HDU78_005696 [Chytriomyces hyalinus]KAJ3266200.1 hypothetical protein HDU77_002331 [Chytriomyces hyalinus]
MQALALLLAASSAFAHFTISSPKSRKFDEDTENLGPCGNQVLGARSQFPITGGSIKGDLFHPTATANFSIVISNTDPTASQFGKVFVPIDGGKEATNVALKQGSFDSGSIDLSKVSGAVEGANATLQVVVSTTDGTLYQCMDVTLSKDAAVAPAASSAAGTGNAAAASATGATTTTKSSAMGKGLGLLIAVASMLFVM